MIASIHVPASVVQRIVKVLGWATPPASLVLSAFALSYRWIGDRASTKDVGAAVAPALLAAKEAQSLGHHCSSTLSEHELQLAAAWAQLVELHAELEVYRRYGSKDARTRGELAQDARRFYRAAYDEQLESKHAPSEAARRALLAVWRPEVRP